MHCPVQMDMDLLKVCRRAVARLSIDWPSQLADQGAEKYLYDGKRLQSRLPPVKQFIPAVLVCMAEIKRFWDKPFPHRVPVNGFSRLDVQGMEDLGMADNPPPLSNNLWQITCTQVAGQRSLQPEPNCQGKQSVSPPLFFKRSVNHLHWPFVL